MCDDNLSADHTFPTLYSRYGLLVRDRERSAEKKKKTWHVLALILKGKQRKYDDVWCNAVSPLPNHHHHHHCTRSTHKYTRVIVFIIRSGTCSTDFHLIYNFSRHLTHKLHN